MEDKYYTESHKKAIDRYDKDFNNTEKNVHNKADSNSKKAYAFAIPAVVIALLLIAFIGIALTGSVDETVNRLFIARIGVFVTCVFPIQQFFALASASHGNFSTLLRHIQTLSLPKISSGKCSSRTGCFLLS